MIMEIKDLKELINSGHSEDVIEQGIILLLAKDKNAIPMILDILNKERDINNDLINELNVNLGKAHIYIDERPETKLESSQRFNRAFIIDEIAKFYTKYSGIIIHPFNRLK